MSNGTSSPAGSYITLYFEPYDPTTYSGSYKEPYENYDDSPAKLFKHIKDDNLLIDDFQEYLDRLVNESNLMDDEDTQTFSSAAMAIYAPDDSHPLGKIYTNINFPKDFGLDFWIKLDLPQSIIFPGMGNYNINFLYAQISGYVPRYWNRQGLPNSSGSTNPGTVVHPTNPIYNFFITDLEWVSNYCVRLHLHMDVLNSFNVTGQVTYDGSTIHVGGRDYDFAGENVVNRQHFDRVEWTDSSQTKLRKKIDYNVEGLGAPLYKKNDVTLYDKSLVYESHVDAYKAKFYLMYMNQDDPEVVIENPVQIFLLSDQALYFQKPRNSSTEEPETFNLTYSLLYNMPYSSYRTRVIRLWDPEHPFKGPHTPKVVFNASSGESYSIDFSELSVIYRSAASFCYVFAYPYSGYLVAAIIRGYYTNEAHTAFSYAASYVSSSATLTSLSSLEITAGPSVYQYLDIAESSVELTYSNVANHAGNLITEAMNVFSNGDDYWTSGQTGANLGQLSDVDLTDPRIIKIIELPYCPFNPTPIVIDETTGLQVYQVPDGWTMDELTFSAYNEKGKVATTSTLNVLVYPNSAALKMDRILTFKDVTNGMDELEIETTLDEMKVLMNGVLDTKNDTHVALESKLLSSEFYNRRIVYDSFSLGANLDEVDPALEDVNELSVEYAVTASANTRILVILDWVRRLQSEDYDGMMVITRNNEVPLYSSSYLDYLKSGYNFDKKNKNINMASNIISAGTGMASAIASGNPLTMVNSAVKGISSCVLGEISAENNLNKQIEGKKMSTNSIAGADDLDLLNIYTKNNKFKFTTYEVNSRLKQYLVKYFQLSGYACSFHGAPDMYSRRDFNFVQCSPSFEYTFIPYEDIMKEISDKWESGVFIVHHRMSTTNSGSNIVDSGWDISLDGLNLEVSLFGGIKYFHDAPTGKCYRIIEI